MEQIRKIEISTSTIIKTILIILALGLLYLVRDIVLLLFIAVIIVAAIDPAVDWMQKKRIPRPAGTLLIYIVLLSLISLVISFLIPPMAMQLHEFSGNLTQYYNGAQSSLSNFGTNLQANHIDIGIGRMANEVGNAVGNIPKNIFSTTIGVFSGALSFVVILSMAFYMSVEEDGIKKFIVSITPASHKKYAASLTERIEEKIGRWMAGQLLLMIIIFILDYIGLSLIGMPYALVLAFLAGILEAVPYVGPIASAVPGIIIGFLISPLMGFLAFLVYLIAQQFETNVIVPQIMKKALGLNPVATISAILIGFKLLGVLGAIIAVPTATAISLVISDILERERK